ncbi:MEMO1 family protein CCP3SC1_v2_100007 [Gammaproteobacteria bacterium]
MGMVRSPAVAGMFYPADPRELHNMVVDLLQEADSSEEIPKALIAPHAGYIYSGPIAATAYAPLVRARGIYKRVVLLGPSHRVGFTGLALSSAAFFVTPLGKIALDPSARETLADLPQVRVLDQAHLQEHSLEVHLPFLQEVLGKFTLIPLVVGDADPESVAEVLEQLWGGPETLIVISSDLSHYHDYATARRLDAATSHAIEDLMPEAIHHEHACGRNPINGLLTIARRYKMSARTLDLRNSGDTAGPRDRVVGYGAYTFLSAPT